MISPTFKETKALLIADAKRNGGSIIAMLVRPQLALILWFRISSYLKGRKMKVLYFLSKFIFHFFRYVTGIQMETGTSWGGGFVLSTTRVLRLLVVR